MDPGEERSRRELVSAMPGALVPWLVLRLASWSMQLGLKEPGAGSTGSTTFLWSLKAI